MTIKSQHSRRLAQLVAERRKQLLEGLVTLAQPHDGYLTTAGKIQGLDEAMQLSEQADRELSGES